MDNYQILTPCVNDSGFTISNMEKEYRVVTTNDYDVSGIFDNGVKKGIGRDATPDYEKSKPYEKRTKTYVYSKADLEANPDHAAWLQKNVSEGKAIYVTKQLNESETRKNVIEKLANDPSQKGLGLQWFKGVPPKFENEASPVVRGEVLSVTPYIVAIKTPFVRDNSRVVQLIPTTNLLNGFDEFKNRRFSINAKLAPGDMVELRFNDNKKLTDITPWKPVPRVKPEKTEEVAKQEAAQTDNKKQAAEKLAKPATSRKKAPTKKQEQTIDTDIPF